MATYIKQSSIIDELRIEPFSKNEAWQWLLDSYETTRTGKISVSIRRLGIIWKWHRSKVERFMHFLRVLGIIKTEVRQGRTSITIVSTSIANDEDKPVETKPRQYQDIAVIIPRDSNQDNNSDKTKTHKSQDDAIFSLTQQDKAETETRQNQDSLSDFESTKKEKNQKKETFDKVILKEKYTPVGSIQKEKKSGGGSLSFNVTQVSLELVEEFATSLGFSSEQTLWELGKFKDYWQITSKIKPRDGIAAFRNWLRRAIEFKTTNRGTNDKSNYTTNKSTATSFERFIAAGTKAIARYELDRLEQPAGRVQHQISATNSSDCKKYNSLSEVN